MSNLKEDFEKLANQYIKNFSKRLDFDFDGWVGYDIGSIALFGDYFFDYSDIRIVVDNILDIDTLLGWYDYMLSFPECKYNLKAYYKLECDFKYELGLKDFSVDSFYNHLLYLRAKSK